MAKAPDNKVFHDLYETQDPIVRYEKPNSTSVLRFRIIEAATEPRIRMDIREYLRTAKYTGWTARGVTVSADQLEAFFEKVTDLKNKMPEFLETPKKKKAPKKTK